MQLRTAFPALELLIRNMGATPVSWRSDANSLDKIDIKAVLLKGLQIELSDLEITGSGLLTYRGEQVLLYIKDSMKDKATLTGNVVAAPRFHVADCRALDRMRNQNRFERYVVTNDTSGAFLVEYYDWTTRDRGEVHASLRVCKDCLTYLNYKGFANSAKPRNEIWGKFSIAEFFESYQSYFRNQPKHTDRTAPSGGYTKDWSEVSAKFRASIGWRCQVCRVELSGHKNLLHVHHADGVKANNKATNLQALCVLCHRDQPQHGHLRVPTKDELKIYALRREQNLGHAPLKKLDRIKDRKRPKGGSAKPAALSRDEAKRALIDLRSRILKEFPDTDAANGILRKSMLNYILDNRITTEHDFRNRVPGPEQHRTDKRHQKFLSEIFSVVRLMR